jgi:hypothetical protein
LLCQTSFVHSSATNIAASSTISTTSQRSTRFQGKPAQRLRQQLGPSGSHRGQQERLMNLFKPLTPCRCCRRLQARPRSQKHCEGKHVTTTFRQEVSEPQLPTNLGASTTILRTRWIVLMSIEANAPQQQQGGSANVRPTPFGRLHARAAGPPHIWTPPWRVACSKTPSHDRRRTASAAWPQRGSVFHQGRIENTFNLHPPCRSTSTAVAGQGRRSVACRTERLAARIIANLDFMDFKQASSIPIPASAML